MFSVILELIGVAGIGVFLLSMMFVLPRRKLPEEKEQKSLHEEKCSAEWRFAKGFIGAGGNIPIARISFYDTFFVVAMGILTKVLYSEVLSTSFKSGLLSNSVTIHLAKGQSLFFHTRNSEKIRSLIESRINGADKRIN